MHIHMASTLLNKLRITYMYALYRDAVAGYMLMYSYQVTYIIAYIGVICFLDWSRYNKLFISLHTATLFIDIFIILNILCVHA